MTRGKEDVLIGMRAPCLHKQEQSGGIRVHRRMLMSAVVAQTSRRAWSASGIVFQIGKRARDTAKVGEVLPMAGWAGNRRECSIRSVGGVPNTQHKIKKTPKSRAY